MISSPYNNGPAHDLLGTQIKCLLDTGCAKTSISTGVYEFLIYNFNNSEHDITQVDMSLMSCTGELKPIDGMTKIRIYLTPEVYRDTTAMVVEDLAEDVIIGYDFISSPWTQAMTKRFLIMKNNNREPDIHIPILHEYSDEIPCNNIRNTYIKLVNNSHMGTSGINQRKIPLKGLLKKPTRKVRFAEGTKEYDEDENKDVKKYHWKTVNELMKKKHRAPKHIFGVKADGIPLKNRFETLSEDEEEITVMPKETVTGELTPPRKKSKAKKSEGVKQKKLCINDKAMDEKEKEEAYIEMDHKGSYQPSISQVLEEKSAVTELGLVQDHPLSQQEFLDLFDCDHLERDIEKQAHKIFLENREAFALHKYDIGRTNEIEMKIELLSQEAKMQKYVPIPMNVKDQVKEILDQLLKYDIIRVCEEPSPYCSNILVVKKKDGKSIRLLFDGRLLNYNTKRYPMALISKQEIVAHLIGKKHLTSLDFADAFFHIPLAKEAQPLTAFWSYTHGQRMCFTRAPQGLKNSPLYLKTLLDKLFKDMSDSVLFYADDLLIASDGTIEDHLRILNEVLRRLKNANLKLRPQKLLIAKDTIEFLGMVFKKDKISIPDAKLQAFRNLPSPTTPRKCKSLIMCLSFYRQFCPRFAELSREIMELSTLHQKQFKWTEKHESQLRTLIEVICNNASLYLPNPAKTFYVQTDASQHCAAGRIYQKDGEGNENIVAAVSRTFTKTERAYSIFKKEILALLYTLKSMDYFLRYASKLVILVDAKSIIYLRLAKESSGILLRFSLELSRYNAEIFHVPGEENVVSDVLSRQNAKIDAIQEELEINQTLSEKDTLQLVKRMTLPSSFKLNEEETKMLLNGPSPPAVREKKTQKTKAKGGKRSIKNVPDTLGNKKLNLPKTTNYRPGMLLPQSVTMARTQAQITSLELDSDTDGEEAEDNQNVEYGSETGAGPSNRYNNGDDSDSDTPFHGFERQESETDDEQFHGFTQEEREEHRNIDLDNMSTDSDDEEEEEQQEDHLPQRESDLEGNTEEEEEEDERGQEEEEPFHGFQGQEEDDDSQAEEEEEVLHEYTDVRAVTNIIADGLVNVQQFKLAQETDDFCTNVADHINRHRQFVVKDGLLFKKVRQYVKPVLPRSLYDAVIFTKHFTVFGAHNSATRIERDTKRQYYVPGTEFQKKLRSVTRNCYICQLFNMTDPAQNVKQLPKVNAPRISWSIDIITDAPKTTKGYKQILLCVDDFSSYVVCIPLTTTTAEAILEGLKGQLFSQFGIPKVIRSDQQASFYNSTMFYENLTNMGIELTTTAVASPFSNSRAESQIKNIKHLMRKFLFQEGIVKNWDSYLQILTNSHNKSTGIYGCSSEELMFGTRTPSRIDILDFYGDNTNVEQYIEHVMPIAERMRTEAQRKMDKKSEQNRTFKNRNKTLKQFEVGTLVLHKQLQASTGISSKYKPLYTGPYVIVKINKDRCTAILEHIKTRRMIKAHFTNMQYLYFAPEINRLSQNFDEELFKMLGENYSLERYREANTRYPGPDSGLARSDSPDY